MKSNHPTSKPPVRGFIEVITGSMFSGKTEELIRRLKRAKFAKQKVEIFKPQVDTRYSEEEVVSHDANSITSTPVPSSSNILLLANDVEVVGIDEAQFFDDNLPEVCNQLANSGVRVIVAGLDMDFKGRPFGPMPHLLAIAKHAGVELSIQDWETAGYDLPLLVNAQPAGHHLAEDFHRAQLCVLNHFCIAKQSSKVTTACVSNIKPSILTLQFFSCVQKYCGCPIATISASSFSR